MCYHFYCKMNHPIQIILNLQLTTDTNELIIDGKTMNNELKEILIEQHPMQTTHTPEHYPTTKASLWQEEYQLHSDLENIIHMRAHGQELRDYIIERTQWQPSIFNLVHWPVFYYYYKQQSSRKQMRICKYVHDWQNVGSQKFKIDKKTKEELCPMGCGCQESPMHYWYCKDPSFEGVREDHLTQLEEYLDKIKTSPNIKQHILTCLHYWIQAQADTPITITRDSEGTQDLLSSTVEQQNEIGWEHFLKGRITYQWTQLQDSHCQEEGIEPKYHGF